MDPLSAAASVIGLLGAAAKVSEVLLKFIGNVKGAPKLAQSVLMEISDVSACLSQLQRYLQGALATSSSHEELLMVEQLVVTLSNCVLVFSEFEEMVDSLKPAERMQPWRLAQWLLKEQAISALMVRLQQSKLSLNLMLTTLTCTSVGEARSSAQQLTSLIQQVLDSNLEISNRMANLEMRTFESSRTSAPTTGAVDSSRDDDSFRTMKPKKGPQGVERAPDNRVDTVGDDCENTTREPKSFQGSAFGFTFDKDLNSSRPYARAMRRTSAYSTASSTLHTMGWSCLSDLSLAEVSEVSVIGLPITPQELWNGDRYNLTSFYKESVSEKTQVPAGDEMTDGGDRGLLERKPDIFDLPEEISPRNNAKSFDGSLELSPGIQRDKKVPNTAGGELHKSRKMVLFGASMAGKTTIYHRLQMTHGNGFTDFERRSARESVIHGLVEVFKKARRQHQSALPLEDIEHFETLAYATRDQTLHGIWTLRCYRALKALWSNPAIRSTIENGKDASLNETIPYLLENIDFLFYESTMPDEILLRGCYRTTGVHVTRLDIQGRPCRLYDVGGRRSERKKWPNYLQDVDAVIFVVSLTGYCQTCPEDAKTNQMQESQILFSYITNLPAFKTVPIVLIFNKLDLLKQRMLDTPIENHYPEYPGDSDPMQGYQFFAGKFSDLDSRPNRNLRMIVTSAVDYDDFKPTIDELWVDLFSNDLNS